MNSLSGLEKQIGRIEQAAGLGPCEACAICDRWEGRGVALIARGVGQPDADAPLVTVRGVSRCAWCGRIERRVWELPDTPRTRDLATVFAALEEGRMCAPDVAQALERDRLNLYKILGDLAAEYDEMRAQQEG